MDGLFLILGLFVVFGIILFIIQWNREIKINRVKIIKIDIPPQKPSEIKFPDGHSEILQELLEEEMKQKINTI